MLRKKTLKQKDQASGLMAATLWSVKRRLSQSAFSLSRSSSSFFLAASSSLGFKL